MGIWGECDDPRATVVNSELGNESDGGFLGEGGNETTSIG